MAIIILFRLLLSSVMHPGFAAKEMAETVLEREPEKYLENKMQINITVGIVQPDENLTTSY